MRAVEKELGRAPGASVAEQAPCGLASPAEVAEAAPSADPAAAGAPHEALDHGASPTHHHHSHAAGSRHGHGHHLLQVEGLSVSFRMYDDEAAPFFRAPQRDVEVIHDLSVSVHEGEIVAVVGASG